MTAPAAGVGTSYYGGTQMPDIVGNVRYESGWGSAQIVGAPCMKSLSHARGNAAGNHDATAAQQIAAVGPLVQMDGATSRDYGFAVQGGVKINLPMIAAGDTLWLQAAYGQGTAAYVNSGGFNGAGSAGSGVFDAYNASVIALTVMLYTSGPAGARTSKVSLSDNYQITAAFQHYWTPTIRQSVFGAYGETSYGRGSVPFVNALNLGGISRFTQWQVGSQVVWSPVKDLDIGVEVQYNRNENNNRGSNYGLGAAAVLPSSTSRRARTIIEARIRVQRDF